MEKHKKMNRHKPQSFFAKGLDAWVCAFNFMCQHTNFLGDAFLFFCVISAFYSFYTASPLGLFIVAFALNMNAVLYTLTKLSKHIFFLLFQGCFFLFLLARPFVVTFLGFSGNYTGIFELSYAPNIVLDILFMLVWAQLFLFISYTVLMNDGSQSKAYKLTFFVFSWLLIVKEALISISQLLQRTFYFIFKPFKLLSKSLLPIANKLPKIKLYKVSRGIDYCFPQTDRIRKGTDFEKGLWYAANFIFYLALVFRGIIIFQMLQHFWENGYYGSYLQAGAFRSGILFVLSDFYDLSFFVILSSKPSRKSLIIPTFLYILQGSMLLLAGRRMEFMLSLLVLVLYVFFRNNEAKTLGLKPWISKTFSRIGITMMPVLVVMMSLIENFRTGSRVEHNPLLSFLYKQGVTLRVLGTADLMRAGNYPFRFYSIGNLLEFFRYRILGLFTGEKVPLGQSLERAVNGFLFSQAAAFFQIPQQYIQQGVGIGSSYVAELFVDFGYTGIIVGSLLYGFLFLFLLQGIESKTLLLSAFSFMMLRGLFVVPRGGYTQFLTTAMSSRTLVCLICLSFLAWLWAYLADPQLKNSRI